MTERTNKNTNTEKLSIFNMKNRAPEQARRFNRHIKPINGDDHEIMP